MIQQTGAKQTTFSLTQSTMPSNLCNVPPKAQNGKTTYKQLASRKSQPQNLEPTISGLRNAIPSDYFQHSYFLSFYYLSIDLLLVPLSGYLLWYLLACIPTTLGNVPYYTLHTILVALYWFYQGLNFTALWVGVIFPLTLIQLLLYTY